MRTVKKVSGGGSGRDKGINFASFSHQETVAPRRTGNVVAMHAFADQIRERRNFTSTIKTWEARIEELLADAHDDCYSQPDWNGHKANPLNKQSIEFAAQFLNAMPRDIDLPEIDPSPRGVLSLYWKKGEYQLLLDINAEGIISYAFKASKGLAYTGRPSFFTSIPKPLKDILRQYFQAR